MGKVDAQNLPDCFGTPLQKCGRRRDPMIQGFDNEWRCMKCHEVHVELVYKESGDVNPNTGKPRFVPAVIDPAKRAAALAILRETVDSEEPVIHMPAHLQNQKAWTETNKAMREVTQVERAAPIPEHRTDEKLARRQSILDKYGIKGKKK